MTFRSPKDGGATQSSQWTRAALRAGRVPPTTHSLPRVHAAPAAARLSVRSLGHTENTDTFPEKCACRLRGQVSDTKIQRPQ